MKDDWWKVRGKQTDISFADAKKRMTIINGWILDNVDSNKLVDLSVISSGFIQFVLFEAFAPQMVPFSFKLQRFYYIFHINNLLKINNLN